MKLFKITLITFILCACLFSMPGFKCITSGLENVKFVYNGHDGNDLEIYIMNADGSNKINLTNNSLEDYTPSFSQDGSKILFIREKQVFIMNADGSGAKQLTFGSIPKKDPTFSPSGKLIAFARTGSVDPRGIYILNLDDGTEQRVTSGAGDISPSFSPDGEKIVFEGKAAIETCIFTINIDGSGRKRLTEDEFRLPKQQPSYSPDGNKIVYCKDLDGSTGQNMAIYTMNPDGSGKKMITNFATQIFNPSFSPDGNKIIFEAISVDHEIFIMNVDGNNITQLTFSEGQDSYPCFAGKPR